MTRLPKKSGPHKVNLSLVKEELFELTKMVMASSPKFYQFSSLEEFVNDFSVKYPCEFYIWNSEKGEMVGFFGHYDIPDNANDLQIIVVHPDFQGQGYGRKMMEFYLSLMTGKKKVILSTHEKNHGAIKFYESFGYKRVKELPNQYGDGQTRVLFIKVFSKP